MFCGGFVGCRLFGCFVGVLWVIKFGGYFVGLSVLTKSTSFYSLQHYQFKRTRKVETLLKTTENNHHKPLLTNYSVTTTVTNTKNHYHHYYHHLHNTNTTDQTKTTIINHHIHHHKQSPQPLPQTTTTTTTTNNHHNHRSWCTDLPHGSCMLVSQSVDHSKTYSFLKNTHQEIPHSETPHSETRGSFGGVYEGVSCLQSKECIVTATTATAVTNNNKTTTATAETNNTKSTSNTKQEPSQKTSTPTSIPNTHPPSPTAHPSSTPNTHQSSSPNTQPNPPTFQSYYNLPSKSLQLLSMIRPEVHACHYVMEPCGAGRTRVTMLSRIDYKLVYL